MYFDKIKQDADGIVEAGFILNNLVDEKSKLENDASSKKDGIKLLDERINNVKLHIKFFLDDLSENLRKEGDMIK